MGKFTPTKKQEEAFKEVAKSIKKAKRLGLVFYGKSGSLVAYKANADEYLDEEDLESNLGTGFDQVECISQHGLICDSGADDYGCYRSGEDQEKYN